GARAEWSPSNGSSGEGIRRPSYNGWRGARKSEPANPQLIAGPGWNSPHRACNIVLILECPDDGRGVVMSRIVRGGLIQATLCEPATSPVAAVKKAMIDKHVTLIAEAAGNGAQVVCLQELFYGPYFCAEQQAKWYELTERVPDGPTTTLMSKLAKDYEIVLIVPI